MTVEKGEGEGKGKGRNPPSAARICAQCNAGGEPLYPVSGTDLWLHAECRWFWIKDHPEPTSSRDCGAVPDILCREVPADRRPSLGPLGDSLDDLK